MGGAPDLCYILGGWGSRIVLLNYSVLYLCCRSIGFKMYLLQLLC